MTPLQKQFETLKREYPTATCEALPSGAAVITIRDFPLPDGWSRPTIRVTFVAPVGYPLAKPDFFWTSPELRLRDGAMPHAAVPMLMHEANGEFQLRFSWHLNEWNPNRDDLVTFLRVIDHRLQMPLKTQGTSQRLVRRPAARGPRTPSAHWASGRPTRLSLSPAPARS